jgi:hypothetical protein
MTRRESTTVPFDERIAESLLWGKDGAGAVKANGSRLAVGVADETQLSHGNLRRSERQRTEARPA